jgi:hypothetical protein
MWRTDSVVSSKYNQIMGLIQHILTTVTVIYSNKIFDENEIK